MALVLAVMAAGHAGLLRNADDALDASDHATGDTADHSTGGAADRTGRPVADIGALSGAARDTLGISRKRQDTDGKRRGTCKNESFDGHGEGIRSHGPQHRLSGARR